MNMSISDKDIQVLVTYVAVKAVCKECSSRITLHAIPDGEETYNTCMNGHAFFMQVDNNTIIIRKVIRKVT